MLVRVVALAIAIRAALWIIGLAATGYVSKPLEPTLFLWSRWDAPHYLDIAQYGYAKHGPHALWIAFFPLFPFLVRVVSWVVGDLIASGLVVSLAASVGAAVILMRLVELDGTADEGRRATLLLFAFPTAYFLAAPFSESVFLLTVLAAVYAARTQRWLWAGIFGAFATASRLVGLAVVPALAVEAMWPAIEMQMTWNQRLRRLASIGVSISGFATYLAINARVYGDPLHFLKAESAKPWHQHAVPPWQPVVEAIGQVMHPTTTGAWFWFVYPARLGALVLAAVVLVWGWRRLHLSDRVFACLALGLSMCESRLISLPRYLLPLYPIPMVLASKLKNRTAFIAVVAIGFVLQAYLFSRYATAQWAF